MRRFRFPSSPRGLLSAFCLALLLLTIPAPASADDAPRVSLAGTFNNWSTADDSLTMKKEGDRYEVRRFFRCGLYEFKFVFGGSWDRHLGDAGGDRLAQPGANIKLSCRQSGEYLIWLDTEKKTWGSEKRPATRPYAIPNVIRLSCDTYILDPSLSIPPEGKPLRYKWYVRSSDLTPGDWSLDRIEYTDRLTLKKAGQLEIELVVTDGDVADTVITTGQFGNGFQMSARTQRGQSIGMHPVGDDVWACPYRASHDGTEIFRVAGTGPGTDAPLHTATVKKGEACFVVYDNALRSTTLQRTGYHYFRYDPRNDDRLPEKFVVERVEIAGEFNNWRPGTTQMRLVSPGIYETLLRLPDGVHHYKLVVNGAIFLEDPAADPKYGEPDTLGEKNSGVLVGDDASRFGEPRPDHLATEALLHLGRSDYFTPYSNADALVTLRTLASDATAVRLWPAGAESANTMTLVSTRDGFDFWRAALHDPSGSPAYRFEIVDGNATRWYDAGGVHDNKDDAHSPFTQSLRMKFETPDWAKKVVWYQIFPERFRNGTPDNDPPRTVPWTQHWDKPYKPADDVKKGSPADFVETGGFFNYIFDRRYGGDLQGVREKLGYLRDLGITGIYFNPIFLAESLHKYDASDFRHIDDFFGVKDSLRKIEGETTDPKTWQWSESDKVFLDFLNEAHRMGFKVIIDGVFNHVGRDFWAFKDVLKNGKRSPYADWFDITSWNPFHYKAWDGDDGSLPRLKHDDALGLAKPVREHLFAVTRRWMDPNGDGDPSDGIDGWRLDVAADINENFWKDWRKLVKSINKDAYIVAELWEESRPWLDGRTFDAVMNYPFAVATQRFFVNQKKASKPSELQKELERNLGWYVPQVNYVLQNLFDSHDTDRVASMFMNPDLEYDKNNRLQDNGPHYNTAKPTPECYHRLKAMVTFQMTFLGAPMVYYGDEAGMYGADDPSDRKPMYWSDLPPNDDPNERIEKDVLDHYRRAIAIRNTFPCLNTGMYHVIEARDDSALFVFSRTLGGETVVAAFNNGDRSVALDVPSPWPNGTAVGRADDPASFEMVEPDVPTSRPTVRAKTDGATFLKIENGRLRGVTIESRSAAVFAKP